MVKHSKYWSSGALKYILCIIHEMKINVLLIFYISLKYLSESFGIIWKFSTFYGSGKNKIRREKRFNLVKIILTTAIENKILSVLCDPV